MILIIFTTLRWFSKLKTRIIVYFEGYQLHLVLCKIAMLHHFHWSEVQSELEYLRILRIQMLATYA